MKSASSYKILMVDDEEPIRKLLSDILIREGYACQSVSNVNDALEILSREEFSLVISDINMPGRTGIELLDEILERYPNLAVIMSTGVDDRNVGISTLEKGAYAYLIKPFARNELLINVSNAIHRSELEISNRRYRLELESLVQERTRKLEKAEQKILESREETIHRLAKAAEFRDNETARHTVRMGHYCYILAKCMDFSESYCERIRQASPLHDVGKIGISDTILLKPGKLTFEEFETVKEHTNFGYRILSDSKSSLLALGASIAVTHHEKIDGSGYPNGLVGEEIPIEGRIAAICDVFDALTSDRVYKKAMSVDEAISIMKEGSGSHFDKDLLELFLRSMDEILLMKEKFADKPN